MNKTNYPYACERIKAAISEPCPLAVYQAHVRDVLLGNSQATTQFLNSLLNQLNWAFSEFIGMVQEIHNVSSRPERVFIESRQLKICATCFHLAISLLRVLEMISTVAPGVFSDPTQSSSEILLARLCQLLCQVLNRMEFADELFPARRAIGDTGSRICRSFSYISCHYRYFAGSSREGDERFCSETDD